MIEQIKTWLWARLSPAARAGTIQIKAAAKEEAPPLSALFFLLAGVGGFLGMLRTLEDASFHALPVFGAAGAACLLLWWGRRRGIFSKLCPVLVLLCTGFGLLRQEVLGEQFRAIGWSLLGAAASGSGDVTEAAVLLAAASTIALGWLELAAGLHLLPLLAAEGLLLLGPLLGFRVEVGTAALLLVFQVGFWALRVPGGDRKRGARTAVLLLAVFLLALPLSLNQQDRLYEAVYALEGRVLRAQRERDGSAYAALVDGAVSRGNNYRTGAVQLILEADRAPTETLYLRGFAGGDYLGGDWAENLDGDIIDRIENEIGYYGWYDDNFSEMYYLLNYYSHPPGGHPPEPRQLTIRHGNREYEDRYAPYYSSPNLIVNGENSRRNGYSVLFYEQGELHIDWDALSTTFRLQADCCRQLQEGYLAQAREVYTRVPAERLPRLNALCAANPQEDLEDITAFILYTLHSNTSYTLIPGLAPINEDVVENFLFERGRGYCAHYAAAATLMYRLYGVPARYAAGYVVPPEAFEPQEDGGFTASVTDWNSHAWVEIFLEDYGWVPVEVTPQEAGVAAASYPGVSAARLEQLQVHRGWDLSIPSLSGQRTDRTPRREDGAALRLAVELPPALVHALWACAAYTLLLLPVLLDWRRLRRLRYVDRGGARRAFSRLLEMLARYGILTGCTGGEPDFARKLAEALPAVEPADAERLVAILNQAAYGPDPPGEAETAFAVHFYHRAAAAVRDRLPWYRKLAFRFWFAFG